MSNEIYGFADFPSVVNPRDVLEALRSETVLGLFPTTPSRLIGFPEDLAPSVNSLIFLIGDSPESTNAEYLLDNQDYDPSAPIGVPHSAQERLGLLIDMLEILFAQHGCERVALCLTTCNQVDSVVPISRQQFPARLRRDGESDSPPCLIYVIRE